jgi:putative SOS response-associated peptidase YedK
MCGRFRSAARRRRGDALQTLLRPFPAELMEAHTIGQAVGNVRNDGAVLIERVSAALLPG